MSKVFSATCEAGVVKVGENVVPGVEVLTQGVAASTGILILDGENAYYFPTIGADLKTTLEKLVEILTQVKTALDKTVDSLTAIDTVAPLVTSCGAGVGTATWVPVAAATITPIGTAATQLESIKADIESLIGNLI
jgi:hypothetical protein